LRPTILALILARSRPAAERGEGDARVHGGRLGHDVDRVGVVEDARLGSHLLEVTDDALQHVDGAQGHEEASRSLGLLADDAVRQRDALVKAAGLEATRPVAAEDGVHVGQPGSLVGRGREAQVHAARGRHAFGEAPHDVQVRRIKVDEHDLRAGEARPVVVDEGGHGARRARGGGQRAASSHQQRRSGRAGAIVAAPRVSRSQRTRSTMTRVLPVPAPAMTTSGPSPHSTMRRCSSVRPGAAAIWLVIDVP
jgi:hypothetical protein